MTMRIADRLLNDLSDEVKAAGYQGWGVFHRSDEEQCTWVSRRSCDRENYLSSWHGNDVIPSTPPQGFKVEGVAESLSSQQTQERQENVSAKQ